MVFLISVMVGLRRSRWMLAAVGVLAACCLLVWFAPTIMANSPLRARILAMLSSGFEGEVQIRSIRLGWFSAVQARGVAVRDPQGNLMAEIDTVRTETSLIRLLQNSNRLGVVHIEQPHLSLHTRADGSNLEDVLAQILAQPPSDRTWEGTIQVTDGSVTMRDSVTGLEAELQSINATVQLRSTDDSQGSLKLESGELKSGAQIGSLTASATWHADEASSRWSVSLHTNSVALAVFQPFLRRASKDVQVRGSLTGEASVAWQSEGSGLTVSIERANVQSLHLIAPAWLGQDELAIDQVRVTGSCVVGDGTWQVSKGRVDFDSGYIVVDGEVADESKSGQSNWPAFLEQAAGVDIHVRGEADLADLARKLPHTLHIRAGTEIQSGKLGFEFTSQREVDGRNWVAKVETSNLAALRDGRRLTWDEPLVLSVRTAVTAGDWRVERLDCQSSFLQLTGNGTSSSGSFGLNCDLDRCILELQQFLDLGTFRAAGNVTAGLHWQRTATGRLSLDGDSLV